MSRRATNRCGPVLGAVAMLLATLVASPQEAWAEQGAGDRVKNFFLYLPKMISKGNACIWNEACPLGTECIDAQCKRTSWALAERDQILGQPRPQAQIDQEPGSEESDEELLAQQEDEGTIDLMPELGEDEPAADGGGSGDPEPQLVRPRRRKTQDPRFRDPRRPDALSPRRPGPADPMADRQCGRDRRCRIDRLRRQNQARRKAQKLREEYYVEKVYERINEEKLEDRPRAADPINIEAYLSLLGYGLTGGYTLLDGTLRAEAAFQYNEENYYGDADINGSLTYYDGYHEGFFFFANATYLFTSGWLAPYVTAGLLYGSGTNTNYAADFGGGGGLGTTFHGFNLAGGIDIQLSLGVRGRLGVTVRPLIYNQARRGPGQYDEFARQALSAWWNSDELIGVDFSIGWAF